MSARERNFLIALPLRRETTMALMSKNPSFFIDAGNQPRSGQAFIVIVPARNAAAEGVEIPVNVLDSLRA